MRGQRIFNEIIKDKGLYGATRKGRNNSLIFKRNECLAARYYYYSFFKNMCYEEIIRQLVSEFFVSPKTIVDIIQCNTAQVQSLKQKAPSVYYLQSHWPHLKW